MKDIVAFASAVVQNVQAVNGHSDTDWAALRDSSTVTSAWSRDLAKIYSDAVFEQQDENAQTNRGDHQSSFAVWYENLVSGTGGEILWAETCLIGLDHAASGVSHRHVVAMGGKVEEEFLRRCHEAFDTDRAREVFGAFHRVFSVALAIMLDSYMHAIMRGMAEIGMNERLVARIRRVAIRRMIEEARSVLPLIEWNDSLSVGMASIDEQHKKLVAILNRLHESSVGGRGNEELKGILGELVNYTVEHFAYEEGLFDDHNYPDKENHKKAHEALKGQVAEFNTQFQAGQAKLSGDLFMFLRTWLNGHIRGTDKLYAPHLTEHGVK